jgi:O-antigen/teichoic acid export membrane protein
LLGSSLALRTVAALLACAGAVATAWLLGYDVRTRVLTGALILAWLPQYLGLSFGWVFRSYERMDRDAQLNVVLKLATLICSIVCLALGGRLLGLVLTWCVAGCLTFALGIAMYRSLRLPTLSATMSTVRSLLRDGTPMFTIALAVAIEPFFNTNILYKLTSPTIVGWYGAAANIAGTLIAPATVLGATLYPRLSAAGDAAEFRRAFDTSLRPLLLLAVLGAVGTYLFADVPVELIYGLQKFGPAVDTLRLFAPVMLLMYIDIFLGRAIFAAGRAGRLAGAKVASVVVTAGLGFVLVPLCQARFGNGGLGVMYAMLVGELLMFVAHGILLRDAIDSGTISDACRCMIAGAATVLAFRLLPGMSPFLGIPLCVLVFGGLSLLIGAVKRSDVDKLVASFSTPRP